MKLFEHQAKDLFREAGIPVPEGRLVSGPSDLDGAVREVGVPCAIKAQVLQGGRGKAGLIQLAYTDAEAREKAAEILEKTGRGVLLEQALDIEKELYLSITPEPVSGSALVMASAEGGVEIEEVARTRPEKIVRELVDVSEGLMPFQARDVMFGLGLEGDAVKQGGAMLQSTLWPLPTLRRRAGRDQPARGNERRARRRRREGDHRRRCPGASGALLPRAGSISKAMSSSMPPGKASLSCTSTGTSACCVPGPV